MTLDKGYDSCGRSARLSQEEFGELLDTTRQTVSRRELDQVCPEISKIVMASKRLSVTTDSLLRDGITTFEDDCGEFSCGVYRSSVAEVVQTEKFTLIYYKAPDTGTMGVRLYFGYRAQKRLVAVCEHIRAQSRTEYAFSARQNGAVISNSARLSKLLGEGCSDTVTEGMRRTERFDIDREAKEQPRVSEAGIPRCLSQWRRIARYDAAADRLDFRLCTGKTEYVFTVTPEIDDIYCGASYNRVFDIGLFSGGQFFRIRSYGDNTAPFCGFHCDFSYEPSETRIPTERLELGRCTVTEVGTAWTLKRCTDDEIVLQGCGDDEYIYRRGDRADERFADSTSRTE